MSNFLLSVVVPTKNRKEYIAPLIEIFNSFENKDIELIIQDNSDDDSIRSLAEGKDLRIGYYYDNRKMSVVENCDLAINHSHGKYVCFLGDDDLFSPKIYDFTVRMDQYKYESAIFNVAKYYWPGVKFKVHKFPNLIIKKFKGEISEIDIKSEFDTIMKKGAVSLGNMPKVYHGIVLRERLNEIYKITGTYFPGPSPDMANAVALSFVLKNLIYCDAPFIISGTSPKSTAGMGAAHMHKGNLKDIDFLPNDVSEKWNKNIPKIWTGSTIYVQSAFEALQNLKKETEISKINFNYFYAYFYVFCPDYRYLLKNVKRTCEQYSFFEYLFSLITIFLYRTKQFLMNFLMLKKDSQDILCDGLNTSLDAEAVVKSVLEATDVDSIFKNIKRNG